MPDSCCKKFWTVVTKGWNPNLGNMGAFWITGVFGILMLIVGISLFFTNGGIVTTKAVRYDSASSFNAEANVSISVTKKMKAPIYVYLVLNNFYQNSRLMIGSRSNKQLAGESLSATALKNNCKNAITNKEMGVTQSWDGVA